METYSKAGSSEAVPVCISSVTLDIDVVPDRDYLTFDENQFYSGDEIKHKNETDLFLLDKDGIYFISFHTIGYIVTRGMAQNDIIIGLKRNKDMVDGTYAQESVSLPFEKACLNFSIIIEARAGDELRVKNLSQEVVRFIDSCINIIKIG